MDVMRGYVTHTHTRVCVRMFHTHVTNDSQNFFCPKSLLPKDSTTLNEYKEQLQKNAFSTSGLSTFLKTSEWSGPTGLRVAVPPSRSEDGLSGLPHSL